MYHSKYLKVIGIVVRARVETVQINIHHAGCNRCSDLKTVDGVTPADAKDVRVEHGRRAGWLSPIPLEPKRVRKKTHLVDAATKAVCR